MQVSIETTSGLERRLTVAIPANTVDAEVTKRLNDAAKTVRINGFRKGKVPMRVVKQRFGAGVRQEVLGDTINRSFYEALQKEAIRPAGQPNIEPKQMDEGKDIEYVATFEVYPVVELQGLEGLEVTKYDADIADADVDKIIDTLRENNAEWNAVERAAADGEQVNIDFDGTKDGEAFDGGAGKGVDLILGSNTMIAGFESGLVGAKAGDEVELNLTFPDDYQAEDLRGAAVVFKVVVNTVSEKVLPELNDEFFAKFGVTDSDTEKFKEEVQENMEREKQIALKAKVKDQLMDALLAANEIETPKSLVSAEIDAMRNQMVQQYGGAAENMDLRSLLPDDMFRERAQKRTALGLLVAAIVDQEKLKADKDVVRQLIEDAAATYQDPESVINQYYGDERLLASVEAAALEEGVVDFLLSKASIAEVTVSYEEAIKPLEAETAATE